MTSKLTDTAAADANIQLHHEGSGRTFCCDLPAVVSPLGGEARLIHQHVADLLLSLFEAAPSQASSED